MSPTTRTAKLSTTFLFLSLMAFNAVPSTNGIPCSGQTTHTTAHHYSPTNAPTQHAGGGAGAGQGETVTKTVTKTTTDFVTQTHAHRSSPVETNWQASSTFVWGSGSGAVTGSSASPTSASGSSSGSGAGQCNTGPVQCCNSVQPVSSLDSETSFLLHTLDVVIDDVDTLIGSTCSPLAALGLGNCGGTTVCCNDNSYNGLINVGCIPIVL